MKKYIVLFSFFSIFESAKIKTHEKNEHDKLLKVYPTPTSQTFIFVHTVAKRTFAEFKRMKCGKNIQKIIIVVVNKLDLYLYKSTFERSKRTKINQ